jgi:hypothetical protein
MQNKFVPCTGKATSLTSASWWWRIHRKSKMSSTPSVSTVITGACVFLHLVCTFLSEYTLNTLLLYAPQIFHAYPLEREGGCGGQRAESGLSLSLPPSPSLSVSLTPSHALSLPLVSPSLSLSFSLSLIVFPFFSPTLSLLLYPSRSSYERVPRTG